VTFRFSLSPRRGLAGTLQDWTWRHREAVFSLVRIYPRGADFRPPARLTPIPGTEGLIEMLADLQNRRPIDQGAAARRSPGRLLVEAAGLLGQVPFYRLQGGTIDQRVELVEKVFPPRTPGERR
jgi:hypothetical protein